MLLRVTATTTMLLIVLPVAAADKDAYSIKVQDKSAPPKELPDTVRKLLAERSVQLLDAKGEVLAEVWMRKEVPAKATEAQLKNGLTYREVPETTLLGAVKLPKQGSDYRKQKIPPGVYTLRLGYQPQDGDHMGTAPYSEFVLLSPAKEDKGAETMEIKALTEMSAKSTNGHPAVWLLFPPDKGTGDPKLANKGDGHWVLFFKQDVLVGTTKGSMGIGLALIGQAASAE
jgi:hypothetical protein